MRQVYNGKYQFLGLHRHSSLCELKVYVHDERYEAIVIWCEIPSNPGTSVTNAAELLANVVHEKVLGYKFLPQFITWVEHYPQTASRSDATFDLVRFKHVTVPPSQAHVSERVHYSEPQWKRSSRAEVEKLIGVPVEVRHLEQGRSQPA